MHEPASFTGRRPSAPSSRGTYHHGDLRNGFIQAALVLVAERGVHGFSLRQAARALGVSPSAAYRHFADKDALLDAIASEGVKQMAASMRAAGESAAPEGDVSARAIVARLWAHADALVEFAVSNPAYFRVMSVRPHGQDISSPTDECAALAAGTFDALVAAGGLAESDRHRALLATWAGLFGLATLFSESMHGADDAGFRRSALDAVLRTASLGLGIDESLLPEAPPLVCPNARA
jgi:AcrR family transcriptional regulator